MQWINGIRSYYGAIDNRLQHEYDIAGNIGEKTQAAESRLRDTDISTELTDYWKQSILKQSTSALMTQAMGNNKLILEMIS